MLRRPAFAGVPFRPEAAAGQERAVEVREHHVRLGLQRVGEDAPDPGSFCAVRPVEAPRGGVPPTHAHAGAASNTATLRVRLLNSTATRCTGPPEARYLSA